MTTDMEINGYEAVMPAKSLSAPATPTDSNKTLQSRKVRGKGRRVNFPNDDMIVTGYFDPPDPWRIVSEAKSDSVLEAYEVGCEKQGIEPLPCIAQQLQGVKAFGTRDKDFSLKGENLDLRHCEALEEIFKRVQFKEVNLEECHLDDEGAAALFDMIEYYESANQLTLSLQKNIDSRSWQACSRMLKKTPSLQCLSTKNMGLTEQCLLTLGRALRLGSNLVTLNMENCGLSGKLLVILVAALKLNTTLQELYLGENQMLSSDGIQLGNLMKSNSYLELLDLSYNNLQDEGLAHLCYGLSEQQLNFGKGLKSLILWDNKITHKGMEYISLLLTSTKSLEDLNLGCNAITNEGIHCLKSGLLYNSTLETLQLKRTDISCEGAVALAEYIADNKHIKKLDLKENNIKAAGLMALALSMKHNQSIISLELDAVVTKDTDGLEDHHWLLKEMAEYCERNKTDKIPIIKTYISPNNKIFQLSPAPLSNHIRSPTRNRFQVSRVYLEKDSEKSDDVKLKNKIEIGKFTIKAVIEDSSITASNNTNKMEKTCREIFSEIEPDSEEVSSDGNLKLSTSLTENNNNVVWTEEKIVQNSETEEAADVKDLSTNESMLENCIDDSEMDDEIFIDNEKYLENISKTNIEQDNREKKDQRITFTLPDNPRCIKSECRLNMPVDTTEKLQICKLCKQFDSLDLKSSVPLSPTRLIEGWSFPDPPVDIQF